MARSRRGGGVKVIPNLASDQEGTRVLNLSVLRRLDPAVTDILITATHVVAYNFDDDTKEWSRKPVEGSLFVVKRLFGVLLAENFRDSRTLINSNQTIFCLSSSGMIRLFAKLLLTADPSDVDIPMSFLSKNTQPRFQLVVMNRINTENLVEDLLTDFEYEVQVPYVMYRNASDEIIGIWFYDQQECHEVAHLFSRIQYAFSKASPKASRASKSEFEELEVASAVPTDEGSLEQSASSSIVPDDAKRSSWWDFLGSAPSPSHQPHSASASQTSALHNLLLSRTSSVHMRPFDADISHNSATIEPSSLVKVTPTLLPPMTSTQTTMANATSSSLSVLPPLHPPLASYQPQSVPLPHHPFPLPMASPSPPYGMPLLQPFPPPKPSPLLTPAASYVSVLTRDQVKDALLRLVQNDNFIDMVYREMAKRP
ncbi:hypothetical protein EJB05_03427 [Eragrostis curvula]|uniref:WH1 domain-containing protein n=1 Tax=Eragrostis curvula TaxID=38414 RepID=A0A5J9W7T2_9POAL|nr:hypothetical protein EJB05_03427 [Eragrostis curvula]